MKETIIQHNSISNSKHDLSSTQMDILFVLISKIRDGDPENKIYEIPVKELERYTNTPSNYRRVRDATKELGAKSLEQVYNDGSFDQIWIFSRVKYEKGRGVLSIRLSPDIRPYLFDLKKNFTVLNFKYILMLRSKFSKRLYQIICSKRHIGKFTIQLDTLKDRLGVLEQYSKFSSFRKYVLDVAMVEVSTTDVRFEYKPVKQGRRVTDIEFTVISNGKATNQQVSLSGDLRVKPKDRKENGEVRLVHPEQHLNKGKVDLYERCSGMGLTDGQIKLIFETMGFKEITKTLYRAKLAMFDRGIRNPRAFLASCFDCLGKGAR